MKNYPENWHQKLVPDHFLILVNTVTQNSQCIARNSFKNKGVFERGLSKTFKKLTCFFSLHPDSSYGQHYKKQNELVTSLSLGCKTCLETLLF